MASKETLSLATSIFAPFAGLPSSATPSSAQHGESGSSGPWQAAPRLSSEDKLKKILEHVDRHQEAVRKNMITAIEKRGLELTQRAKEELANIESRTGPEVDGAVEEERRRQRVEDEESFKRLMLSLRTVREEGRDYEEKPADWAAKIQAENNARRTEEHAAPDGDGDTEMHDVTRQQQQRTSYAVRTEWSRDLKELVSEGVKAMLAYDVHADKTYQFYKDALARARARSAAIAGDAPGQQHQPSSTASSAANSRRGSETTMPGPATAALVSASAAPPPSAGSARGPRDGAWIDPRRR
ncbi:hypothetical protein PVAG01_07739 [Phlyctema vagabunda]|uniref:Uncharacterized protein n=1 Tax=Phlyctema vagabunda TaxID=108571 RepID=A0ABR4PDA0_9HELO